jgi:hypothetical protein
VQLAAAQLGAKMAYKATGSKMDGEQRQQQSGWSGINTSSDRSQSSATQNSRGFATTF